MCEVLTSAFERHINSPVEFGHNRTTERNSLQCVKMYVTEYVAYVFVIFVSSTSAYFVYQLLEIDRYGIMVKFIERKLFMHDRMKWNGNQYRYFPKYQIEPNDGGHWIKGIENTEGKVYVAYLYVYYAYIKYT